MEVFSCFAVRSRRRRNEDDAAVSQRSAFRVCICADDTERLIDTRAWPDSITVSEWFFKQRTAEEDLTDKRRRVESGGRGHLQLQPQRTSTVSLGKSSAAGVSTAGADGSRDTTAVVSCCASNSVVNVNMDEGVADHGDDDERTVIM